MKPCKSAVREEFGRTRRIQFGRTCHSASYRTQKDIYSNRAKPYRVFKRERDDGAMFLYSAFITPSTLTISLYLLTLPAIVIILLVWFIRKRTGSIKLS